MKTIVVNIYKEKFDVYCGRAGKGCDGYFGNPFKGNNRDENIKKYKEFFNYKINNDLEFKKRIIELKGKKLGCFCKPKSCHVDVIAEYLNNL